MTVCGRRSIALIAAVCAACAGVVATAPAAGAADCPVPRAGEAGTLLATSSPGRPTDWVMVITVAGPSGAKRLKTRSRIVFDYTGASPAAGRVIQHGSHVTTIINDLRGNRRHDTVRVGNVTVERRAKRWPGPGRHQYSFGGSRTVENVAPCQTFAELVFVPGARASYANADVTAGSGRAFVFGGRGGSAVLASDAESRFGAVVGGTYVGQFRSSWRSDHGLVGGLSMSCRNCEGAWVNPTGQRTSFGYLDTPEFQTIAGPAGRWTLALKATPSGGNAVLGSPLMAAWADVGELRHYITKPVS